MLDPWRAQRRLVPEHRRRPLRRRPYKGERDQDSGNGLQSEAAARRHRSFPRGREARAVGTQDA